MNKKAISILLTAAMGVSVLAAGTVTVSAAEKKDKYVIGMSQCNLGEPWRVAMNDQIAMAAEKHPEFEPKQLRKNLQQRKKLRKRRMVFIRKHQRNTVITKMAKKSRISGKPLKAKNTISAKMDTH